MHGEIAQKGHPTSKINLKLTITIFLDGKMGNPQYMVINLFGRSEESAFQICIRRHTQYSTQLWYYSLLTLPVSMYLSHATIPELYVILCMGRYQCQELMSSRRLRRSVQLSISGYKSALNITADQTGPYTDGLSAQVTLPSSGSTR